MKQYRIDPGFFVDPVTEFPHLTYHVQEKTKDGWNSLPAGIFDNPGPAMQMLAALQNEELERRVEKLRKRRETMRRMSGGRTRDFCETCGQIKPF